jgi:SAM-dependent methyltransferase
MSSPLNRHPGAHFNRVLARVLSIPQTGPEISDRIVAFNAETLAREAVHKQTVVREFVSLNNQRAANIVEALPVADDDVLDADAVDKLLVRVHCEMQRMSEEFQHGRRVAELLNPLLRALREDGFRGPIRVVDIGCGTGFVVRWLTANAALEEDVELIGADYHPALVNEAQRLAGAENLSCKFVVANAFKLAQPAVVYLSTGILHHFRGPGLIDLFKQHNRPETCAFLHFDFHASVLAPFGSWLFHEVRMREPLAKYDGVLSAVRAYPSNELLAAARTGAPEFATAIYGTRLWGMPIPRVFHALVGILPRYRDGFIRKMGKRIASLGVIE